MIKLILLTMPFVYSITPDVLLSTSQLMETHRFTYQSEDIESHLKNVFQKKLRDERVILSPEANDMMNEFIKAGAIKLKGSDEQKIKEAEKNLLRFTDSLISDAGTIAAGREISAATVKRSRKGICPLFPFC